MDSLTVSVTRSAGDDGAVVVFIDTTFEPNASDGSPGLRVLVNDCEILGARNDGVGYVPSEDGKAREAREEGMAVELSRIDY